MQLQKIGFSTLQQHDGEMLLDATHSENNKNSGYLLHDTLSKLYVKAAKQQGMNFEEYCAYICSLNDKQRQIVMYNRAWCKSYINSLRHGQKVEGFWIFLSGSGGTGKSHVVCLIQRDMSYLLHHVLNPELDQPIVLITAPSGSTAYNIGGSTIHAAFSMYDNSKMQLLWEKQSIMQLKLEHMMVSVTDEISMVGSDQFQCMN